MLNAARRDRERESSQNIIDSFSLPRALKVSGNKKYAKKMEKQRINNKLQIHSYQIISVSMIEQVAH